jgi:hypothetical protein
LRLARSSAEALRLLSNACNFLALVELFTTVLMQNDGLDFTQFKNYGKMMGRFTRRSVTLVSTFFRDVFSPKKMSTKQLACQSQPVENFNSKPQLVLFFPLICLKQIR